MNRNRLREIWWQGALCWGWVMIAMQAGFAAAMYMYLDVYQLQYIFYSEDVTFWGLVPLIYWGMIQALKSTWDE